MPQLNKGFSKSKMNKDMDERVVGSGEYRDALNIQISSSDGSDVGAAQTLLGNTLISSGIVPSGSTCVGSIAHNKKDKIYYFVAGPRYEHGYEEGIWKDYIIEYDLKSDSFRYVFVDIYRVHLKTTGVSSNRDISIASSSPDVRSVRRDMNINGYDSNGNHIIYSNNSQLTEVISIGTPPNTINIYSSTVDYNTTSVPSGTLLKIKPKNQILRFHRIAAADSSITGINIIDDMLFWTDNYSEPKKINIKRSIAGTGGSVELPPSGNVFDGDSADYHTRLCVTPDKHNDLRVKARSATSPWYVEEGDTTVIKRGPLKAPTLIMSQHEDDRGGYNTFSETDGSSLQLRGPTGYNSFSYVVPGTSPALHKVRQPGDEIKSVYVANPVHWRVGDLVMFNQQQDINSAEGFTEHDVRATVTSVPTTTPATGPFDFMIESIDVSAIDEEQKIWNLKLVEKPPMFEFKFVRFGYRYKYEDGEYSTFSPWSELAFLPGEYDYLPKKGYNLGMTNRLRQLKVADYITEDIPKDVIQVDILFKNESSPNIYKVESIKSTDGWDVKGEKLWPDKINFEAQTGLSSSLITSGKNTSRGEYEVTSELIHSTIPSNQLLRPYDNLPRRALAQEITSNRLVYGNYVQNFDLVNTAANVEVRPLLNVVLSTKDAPLNAPEGTSDEALNGEDNAEGFAIPRKTCRSLREYQIGVVYGDKFGRETPVLAGAGGSGSLTIDIANSSTVNKLRVDIGSHAPSFAHYYKFYIKETSNEYYNLAMDRYYDAEDGNIWLSFASADRNKLDIETHIVLKKKHNKHEPVTDTARYKILAIENSAPKFIKTNIKSLGSGKNDGDKTYIGTSGLGFPMEDYNEMWIKTAASGVDKWFNQSVSELMPFINDGTLFIRVRTTTIKSEWYQVTKLNTQSSGWYKFTTDKSFDEDVNFTTTDGSWDTRVNGLRIELSRHVVEDKKEFEGRFFVKIYKDLVLVQNLLQAVEPEYRVTQASKIGYWNMPKQSFTEISGGNMVNWERSAILNYGELDVHSSNANGTSRSGDWTGYDGMSNVHGQAFFKSASQGWFNSTSSGCAAIYGTKKWMERSVGRFHIDATWVRGAQKCNGTACSRGSFTNDCDRGPTRGLGVTRGGKSMDIGYVHPGGEFTNWTDANDELFIKALKTVGNNFRFREDPDGIVYTVTGAQGASSDDSRYGRHHTWHKKSSKGRGNNKSRWRIDFERADMPGVGLGQGPAKYHPIGPRLTTKNPAVAELGFYGGRHGAEGWQLTGSNGSDSNLWVPAPDGFAVSQMKSGSTSYPNTINGTSTTGTQQARYYRAHTGKFHHIEIIEPMEDEDGDWSSKNPAVWETEPKEDVGMDLYHEASPALPINITADTNELFAPYGSIVKNTYDGISVPDGTVVVSWSDNEVTLSNPITIHGGTGNRIQFIRPDGFSTSAIMNEGTGTHNSIHVRAFDVPPAENNHYSDAPHNQPVVLSWYNAYTFGNGIESDRIRDDYNQVTIANGVKASTVLAATYEEERRKAGLIHSGIYNSTSGVNNLNQFLAAEKITKDMNPSYGSIQKLHTRDGDIVVFHEDKVMKVLADKDALFNADGKKNVAISSNFLGSDQPFATTYGISKNPESFATDLSGRVYFSDRSKSAILRLSNSGIDNISDYGMKDWFNDHLNPETTRVVGSFDQKKGLYNVTITGKVLDANDDTVIEDAVEVGGVCECKSLGDVEVLRNNIVVPFKKTISYSERSKGWISFKSFLPESALSINNNYYSFKDGNLYVHHDNSTRNNFYGEQFDSSITLLFNDNPASVKSFATINYEGSQARINSNNTDGLYSNLNDKAGWYVENIITNLQDCDNIEFKEKEGKWFGFIKGSSTSLANLDESEFSVQGIGIAKTVVGEGNIPTVCLTITPNINCGEIPGCMDPSAANYNPNATVDSGECSYPPPPPPPPEPVHGCTDPTAGNYNATATVDDGGCLTPCEMLCDDDINVYVKSFINPTVEADFTGQYDDLDGFDGTIEWAWQGDPGPWFWALPRKKNVADVYNISQYTGPIAHNSSFNFGSYDPVTNETTATWSGLDAGDYRLVVYKFCSQEALQTWFQANNSENTAQMNTPNPNGCQSDGSYKTLTVT
ncbi:putative structural protein [uncultured virus]|uniref:Putative structural protein n=1 Tax=uncultured virus TaxID=340016 RepID=A0A218MN76_9VIRU|nr:putative structural protein [uncultured virus]